MCEIGRLQDGKCSQMVCLFILHTYISVSVSSDVCFDELSTTEKRREMLNLRIRNNHYIIIMFSTFNRMHRPVEIFVE